MAEQPQTSDAQPRVIGPYGGLAIVVGSMLGIGIFLTPSEVATHLPSVLGYLAAWVAGGFIAFSGAVAYAELGTRFPEAGGDYVFLRQAFGTSVSFAAGWMLFVGVFTGSVATMAVPLAEFQIPVLLEPVVQLEPERVLVALGFVELTVARAIAIGLIAVLTVINVLGTKLSARAQIALTGIPMAVLAIGAVVIFATTSPAPIDPPAAEGSELVNFGRAVLAVYFAYAGWNAIAYVGGEMKDPGDTIPVSLLGGTALITALYLLLAGCFVFVLGIGGVTETIEAGTATADAVGGSTTTYLVTALIGVALVGSLNGTVLAGGRVGWAMARRDALISAVGKLDDRFETPARALVLQAVVAVVFVLTGTFEMLLELTSTAMFVMGALTIVALFVIRDRDGPEAPYRATGYPWLPGCFVVVTAVVLVAGGYRAFVGEEAMTAESLYPLIGVGILIVTWLGHRVVREVGG